MATVTKEEILKIARLARLSVEEERLDELTADMERIIAFADTISAAGDGAEFDTVSGLSNVFREDEVRPSFDREEILQNAGGGEDGFFRLPKRKEAPAMTGLISSLRSRLLQKELSCTELTERYLAAVAARNGELNAYVTVTPEAALETARRVDRRLAAGEELAPLEGIPMTLKDNLSTKGIETTCCSNMLRGYVPIYDAGVWELLKAQNAVLLGKTNMDEFAMGSSCETSASAGPATLTIPIMWPGAAPAAWRRPWGAA